jgi:hypothetical protein
MAIYRRYKGRRLKRSDRDWDKGTWWIEFSLQGQYIHQSVPGARTQAQAERAESQLREAVYERRYGPGKKLFSEFIDETFLPWSRANKRSHREDAQRSVTLKAFFGETYLRDIKPMILRNSSRKGWQRRPSTTRRTGRGRALRRASTVISLVSQRSFQWLLIMN